MRIGRRGHDKPCESTHPDRFAIRLLQIASRDSDIQAAANLEDGGRTIKRLNVRYENRPAEVDTDSRDADVTSRTSEMGVCRAQPAESSGSASCGLNPDSRKIGESIIHHRTLE